jgi:hypothetical protein
MKMLRVIPLLDKGGARGRLPASICPVPHHPSTPPQPRRGAIFMTAMDLSIPGIVGA